MSCSIVFIALFVDVLHLIVSLHSNGTSRGNSGLVVFVVFVILFFIVCKVVFSMFGFHTT